MMAPGSAVISGSEFAYNMHKVMVEPYILKMCGSH